jgi:peptide/nickel transport system permease protein
MSGAVVGAEVAPGVVPRRAWAFLAGNGALRTGALLSAFILLSCTLGLWLQPYDPDAINPLAALQPPSGSAWLGTDQLGRDELARLLAGGLSTLIVSLPGAFLAFALGTVYGYASALGPWWLDRILMRLLDVVLALPTLVVLIFFASLVRLGTGNLILLIGLIAWPGLARLVRNEALANSQRDFVNAARQLGASTAYIARVHLVRVMAPLLVVNATFLVGDAIFALSALSFLGLGVQPPKASWGELLFGGLELVALGPWWLIVPPGLAIFASLLAASLTGQGLLARAGGAR